MTDYFGRLAARSLEAGKVIQPRLPGLFESTTNGPFTERSTAFEEMETSRLSMAEPRPVSVDPSLKTIPDGYDHLVKGEETRSSKYGRKMMDEHGIEDAPGITSVETNQVRRPKYMVKAPVMDVAVVRPVGITAQVHQKKLDNDFLTASNQDNAMLEETDDRVRSLDAENHIKPNAFDIASGRTLQGSHASKPARAFYAGPLPKMQNQSISTAQTMPTIKVNIGRIEVRAVAQPLPTKQVSAKTPPKLSLEEYTKRSRGGRA